MAQNKTVSHANSIGIKWSKGRERKPNTRVQLHLLANHCLAQWSRKVCKKDQDVTYLHWMAWIPFWAFSLEFHSE